LKHSRDSLINARWLDLGCGGGYFLKALADVGAKRILGLEQDSRLVQMANEALGQKQVECYAGSLAQAVEDYEADIYTAFFVIEHVEKIHTFFSALGRCPSGTIFAFSVPTFGFTTLLESAFSDHFARQLDNVLHTQLYTDSSIRYGLQLAGYVPVAEWVFGQDALDFSRLLLLNLQHHYSTTMLQAASEDLARICDQLQAVLDQNHMADSRHVLAVKV